MLEAASSVTEPVVEEQAESSMETATNERTFFIKNWGKRDR